MSSKLLNICSTFSTVTHYNGVTVTIQTIAWNNFLLRIEYPTSLLNLGTFDEAMRLISATNPSIRDISYYLKIAQSKIKY